MGSQGYDEQFSNQGGGRFGSKRNHPGGNSSSMIHYCQATFPLPQRSPVPALDHFPVFRSLIRPENGNDLAQR